jgi:hypothetical protein
VTADPIDPIRRVVVSADDRGRPGRRRRAEPAGAVGVALNE